MSLSSLLNSTMTIRREGSVSVNGFGGKSGTWADAATAVACRIQQTNSDEIVSVNEGSQAEVATHRIWFGFGVDLRARDRVVISGTTFAVVSVDENAAGAGHHCAAMLVEVRS